MFVRRTDEAAEELIAAVVLPPAGEARPSEALPMPAATPGGEAP